MSLPYVFQLATPPSEQQRDTIVDNAAGLLKAQADALASVAKLYESDSTVQTLFFRAMDLLHAVVCRQGKIVITGIGKSYKIASKLVATLHSFGIPAAIMHPTDALHGDLGIIGAGDALVMISASGNTPELKALAPHLPAGLTSLCLTCCLNSPLALASSGILPAPVPENLMETEVYGLPAPTVTTTACLAVGDALCVTLNEMLVLDLKQRSHNFGRWHPGGAIGAAVAAAKSAPPQPPQAFVLGKHIAVVAQPVADADELDLWRAAARHDLLVAGSVVHASSDVRDALQRHDRAVPGTELAQLPLVARDQTASCTTLSVVNETDSPALVWSSHW